MQRSSISGPRMTLRLLAACLLFATAAAVPPGPPTKVRATEINGYIEVNWSPPDPDARPITTYDIHYQAGKNGHDQVYSVSSDLRMGYLKGIFAYTMYSLTVRAVNDDGESADSNPVEVLTRDLLPGKPVGLTGHLVEDRDIRLNWEHPVQHAGAVFKYLVIYEDHTHEDEDERTIEVDNIQLTYKLDDLQPKTRYLVYVQAKSSHYFSDRAGPVDLTTGEFTPASSSSGGSSSSSSSNNIGAAVGVFFLLLSVTLAVVGGLYYYFRVYNKPGGSTRFGGDSMSFQNRGAPPPSEPCAYDVPTSTGGAAAKE